MKNLKFKTRKVDTDDRQWIKKLIVKRWGAEKIISRGKAYYPERLPGFVAIQKDKRLGLVAYNLKKGECQIISLDSLLKRKGVGTLLVERIKRIARKSRCKRVWLVTTNDNLDALRFWQRKGFVLKNVYPNAVIHSRKLKPGTPSIGNYKIPIRDEIELEFKL